MKKENQRFRKCQRFCNRFIPNFVVITFISAFTFSFLFRILPDILNHVDTHNKLFAFNYGFTLLMYLMWIWSWYITILGDPGRTEDDLRDRGLLQSIKQGTIPFPLKNVPRCPVCGLPKPKKASHCDECGYCHLRYDHHCGVTGQCIADKNFKAFILSFLYSGILLMSIVPATLYGLIVVVDSSKILSIILILYSFFLSFMLLGFGISFFYNETNDLAFIDAVNGTPIGHLYSRLFYTFGDKWWQRFIPYQRHTTEYAWPGINWNADSNEL